MSRRKKRSLHEICNSIVAAPGTTFEDLMDAAKGRCTAHKELEATITRLTAELASEKKDRDRELDQHLIQDAQDMATIASLRTEIATLTTALGEAKGG